MPAIALLGRHSFLNMAQGVQEQTNRFRLKLLYDVCTALTCVHAVVHLMVTGFSIFTYVTWRGSF